MIAKRRGVLDDKSRPVCVWPSVGMDGGKLLGVNMLKAATVGKALSGAIGTDLVVADSDSVGVGVSSSDVATPPRKLFGNVTKNSLSASCATLNNASLATGVLSSRGGVIGPYGRNTIFKILGVLDSPKIILSIVIPIHMYYFYMI